ncbi:hypothetical protein ACOMHN_022907 [Nucella lapillus]
MQRQRGGRQRGGAGRQCVCLALPLLLLLLSLPSPALAMDLSAIVTAFSAVQLPQPCPAQCECSTRRAHDVMQDYVTRYLPLMVPHMRPGLEAELRSSLAVMTSWLGKVAEARCVLQEGQQLNLTQVLHTSTLSFRAVHVACPAGGAVLWDVAPSDASLSVLHLTDCALHKAEQLPSLVLPSNLWVLDLQGVAADVAPSVDLSQASQLRALSFTHSSLSSLPPRWSRPVLHSLAFLSLAHNNLSTYACQLHTTDLKTLSLDYNKLEAVPPCLLEGPSTASHLSLRHNLIHSLRPLSAAQSAHNATSQGPRLAYLDLAHNQLDNLRVLRKLQGLLGLDLSHNHLETMASDTFSLNPQLVLLDLSNNFLEHVTHTLLASLQHVQRLNLSHNSLPAFDFDQGTLSPALQTVDLRYNRLLYPPFASMAYTVPGQVKLLAAHNPFLCDCNIHAFLQQHNTAVREKRKPWLDFSSLYSFRMPKVNERPFVDLQALTCTRPADLKDVPLTSLNFQKVCPLPRGCPRDCKCQLLKEEAPRVSVDCSHSHAWEELPESLPFIPDTGLVLYLNHTALRRLDGRPYLPRVRELYAAHTPLSTVTSEALQALENVSVLDLHHAQLRSLPALTQNLTLPEMTNVSLSDNPWACGCRDLWMADWLVKHRAVVHDAQHVRCHWTGKPVRELSEADLNCGLLDYLPMTIAASLVAGVVTIVASFMAKYRLEILVWLHRYTGLRPLDMFRYDQTTPALFDVFVSFSELDYPWVVDRLLEHLENQARPYRLCTPLRDFPLGAPFADSVAWAADNARCTLLVLSRHLMAHEWTRPNVRAAHLRLLHNHPGKVLVVIHGPLDARCLDREMLEHLRTRVYLKSEERCFWPKLDYALPQQQELAVLLPDSAIMGRVEEPSTVTEIGSCLLSGGLAAGDVTPCKEYAASVSSGHSL